MLSSTADLWVLLFAGGRQRAAVVASAGGTVPVGLRLPRVLQAQPPEATVDRVPPHRPEPAKPPQRPGAAHHSGGPLGREREVRTNTSTCSSEPGPYDTRKEHTLE